MKKIVIVGAGGFGKEVKMLLDQINSSSHVYEFLGFYDDNVPKRSYINDGIVLGDIADLAAVDHHLHAVVAIASPIVRKKMVALLSGSNISFPTLIHPSVIRGSDSVSIGDGCIICAGNIITCNIDIQDFVILNLGCTIGHDSVIGTYTSLMPAVNVSGQVLIQDSVFIGTGAILLNQLTIGARTTIGAGAVVTKTLPEDCTALGVPAKIFKAKT